MQHVSNSQKRMGVTIRGDATFWPNTVICLNDLGLSKFPQPNVNRPSKYFRKSSHGFFVELSGADCIVNIQITVA